MPGSVSFARAFIRRWLLVFRCGSFPKPPQRKVSYPDVAQSGEHPNKNGIDEQERAKNRTKSSVRSKVEHPFQVMKLKFGFVKVRYRGLKKNAHQLFVICGLVNLFLSRKKLLLATSA